MVLQRKRSRAGEGPGKVGRPPARTPARPPARWGAVARWAAVCGLGIGFAAWSLATVAGVYSAASSFSAAPHLASLGAPSRIALASPRAVSAGQERAMVEALVARERRLRLQLVSAVQRSDKTVRLAAAASPAPSPVPLQARFAADETAYAAPDAARFGAWPQPAVPAVVLASLELALPDEPDEAPEEADAGEPAFAAMPDSAPLPDYRPQIERPARRGDRQLQPEAPAQPPRVAKRTETPAQPVMAFARPDNPEPGGIARAFKDLFSGRPGNPRAGNGVAVYDISAARVYMPDGSVLEAHSGIGKMADDPRYVDQKMRGPTPPGTYNLSRREALFYGVEALRMTPVSGKVGYNRSGILAHSYLLRGGRAESHGCVAFRDYPKFLRAFKQGKVRQLVVVPGGSRMPSAVARNGSTG